MWLSNFERFIFFSLQSCVRPNVGQTQTHFCNSHYFSLFQTMVCIVIKHCGCWGIGYTIFRPTPGLRVLVLKCKCKCQILCNQPNHKHQKRRQKQEISPRSFVVLLAGACSTGTPCIWARWLLGINLYVFAFSLQFCLKMVYTMYTSKQ